MTPWTTERQKGAAMKTGQIERTGSRTHTSKHGSPGLTAGLARPGAQILFGLLLVAAAGFPQRADAGDVVFEWNANSEPDIAGYIMYSGKASGKYDTWIDVKNVTRYTVSGLPAGTYYFSLTAYDISGKDSGYANEISVVVGSVDDRPPAIMTVVTTGITDAAATIGWTTDEPSDALVEFGLDANYGSAIAADPALTTTHAVQLTGLAAATTYHYRVKSRDAAGNLAVSDDFSFTTGSPPDTRPPRITDVRYVSVSNNSATITWVTDEPGDTQIEYGTSSAYGLSTELNPALAIFHSQALSGLAAGTVYHFRVKSDDAARNLAVSDDFTFTTTSLPDIESGLVAAYAFDEGAGARAADSSGTANSAVITNATWTSKGKFGKALSFNGKNSFLSAGVDGLPDLGAPKTISCWIYSNAGAGQAQSVVALANEPKQASIRQGFRSSLIGMLQYEGTWIVAANPPPAKAWHHFAYTFDGTENRFYIDGQPVSSSTIAPRAAPVATFQIGRWITGSEYFKGTLDELRVYSRALTQEEILLVMNAPLAGTRPAFSGPVLMEAIQNGADESEESGAIETTSANSYVESTPSVFVEIRLSQDVYAPGETVSASAFWLGNPSAYGRDVELKAWMVATGGVSSAVGNGSFDGIFSLPAGLNRDFGLVPLHQLDSEIQPGSYRIGARIIDPVTGDVLAEDSCPFAVSGFHGRSGRESAASSRFASDPAAQLEGRFGSILYGEYYPSSAYRVVNMGRDSATVELKVWIEPRGGVPTRVLALGNEGSFVLPPGSDMTLDPVSALPPADLLPAGIYQLKARLLDRTTGETLCEDAIQLQVF